jgi:hypothetical protein
MLYAFFWVIPRRLKFIRRRFGTDFRRRGITQKKAYNFLPLVSQYSLHHNPTTDISVVYITISIVTWIANAQTQNTFYVWNYLVRAFRLNISCKYDSRTRNYNLSLLLHVSACNFANIRESKNKKCPENKLVYRAWTWDDGKIRCRNMCFLFSWRDTPPPSGSWPTPSRGFFLDHTQRHSTVGKTPLDEWSARRRDLYLPTHNIHNRQTTMPPVGFDTTISAGERP